MCPLYQSESSWMHVVFWYTNMNLLELEVYLGPQQINEWINLIIEQ